jgi:hypothetical protein
MDPKVSSATENNMIAALGLMTKEGQVSQCRNPLANTGDILFSTA